MAPQKPFLDLDYVKEVQLESLKTTILNNYSQYEGISCNWRALMISLNKEPSCFCSNLSTFPVYYAVNYLYFYINVSCNCARLWLNVCVLSSDQLDANHSNGRNKALKGKNANDFVITDPII